MEHALQHPWITRKFDTEIPRNNFEQNMFFDDMEGKIKKVFNLVFVMTIINNQKKKDPKKSRANKYSKYSISPI